MKITKITIVRHRVADECILHTNLPNPWEDAPIGATIDLVFVVPAGSDGLHYYQNNFPMVEIEIKKVKELPAELDVYI